MKPITEFAYLPTPLDKGYSNKRLYIDLDEKAVYERSIAPEIKEQYIGGGGYALKLLWDAVSANTAWDASENALVCATGPMTGLTQYPGMDAMAIASLCPDNNAPKECTVNGHFGSYLKFCGWDALEMKGKAEKDVILAIDGNSGRVCILDASFVKERDAHALATYLTENMAESEAERRGVAVLCAGRGAEHSVNGALNLSYYDVKMKTVRLVQAERAGLGSVLRDKRVLAVAIKYLGTNGALNNPVDLHEINRLAIRKHREIAVKLEEHAAYHAYGTATLIDAAVDAEILPVCNMQFATYKNIKSIELEATKKYFKQQSPSSCWYACSLGCLKTIKDFRLKSGPYRNKKVILDAPNYDALAYLGANCGIFNVDVILEIRYYCITYGVEMLSYAAQMAFLMECYERGVINNEFTGGHELKFGNHRAVLDILHEMADGRGIGLIVGMGLEAIKNLLVEEYDEDRAFLDDISIDLNEIELGIFLSRDILRYQNRYDVAGKDADAAGRSAQAFLMDASLGLEEKFAILQKLYILRRALEMFGGCTVPWQRVNPWQEDAEDSLRQIRVFYRLYKAMTDREISLNDMMLSAERKMQLHRAFKIRMGLQDIDAVPYRLIGPVTKREYGEKQEIYDAELMNDAGVSLNGLRTYDKIRALRKHRVARLERVMAFLYDLRGWDADGSPTEETLRRYDIHIDA